MTNTSWPAVSTGVAIQAKFVLEGVLLPGVGCVGIVGTNKLRLTMFYLHAIIRPLCMYIHTSNSALVKEHIAHRRIVQDCVNPCSGNSLFST
jgi:hypothetical protein